MKFRSKFLDWVLMWAAKNLNTADFCLADPRTTQTEVGPFSWVPLPTCSVDLHHRDHRLAHLVQGLCHLVLQGVVDAQVVIKLHC